MSPHHDAPSPVGDYGWASSFSRADISDDRPQRPLKPGVYVPTVAFFDEHTEELDLETVGKHAVRMARAGVAGITTQGSNGEAVNLSHRERQLVTKATREALDSAGFPLLPVIVGCGAQSTRETVELCYDALASGGDYALVLPPSYYKTLYKQQSIMEYFTDVATASPIPILIYNFPGAVSGTDLDSDTIIELSKHPNIVGCKLTCGNTGKSNRIAAATNASTFSETGSGFMCMGGSADFTIQTMVGGGSGVICGLANITPKACVKLIELYKTGRMAEAQSLQAAVARADWAAIQGGVVGTKSGLMSHFGYGGYGRKPLPKPTKQEVLKYSEGFKELVEIEKSL